MALYIVPVPIGNLGDITLRAIEALKAVDFVIAEDTRYSLKLMSHLGIRKRLVSYYKPRENEKSQQIIKELKEGKSAALISDSGTPAISDPGHILVKKAIEASVEIFTLPGPTAFVPALVVSGIEPGQFLFLGFPPRKTNALKDFLRQHAVYPYTLIFYESPRRVESFLKTAADVLGSRSFALVKELSKKNEAVIRGNLSQLEDTLRDVTLLGEMVVIIAGLSPEEKEDSESQLHLDSIDDLYAYFKETHNINKNQLKKILMKRKDS